MRVHPVSLWGRSTPCGESGLAAGRTLAPRALRVRSLGGGALAAGRTRPLPEKWCLSEGVGTSQTGNGLLLPGRHTCSRWSRVRAGSLVYRVWFQQRHSIAHVWRQELHAALSSGHFWQVRGQVGASRLRVSERVRAYARVRARASATNERTTRQSLAARLLCGVLR